MAIEMDSAGDTGVAVVAELVDDVGVCLEVMDVESLPREDGGFLASTIAWVFSVHADGGARVGGSDSTNARNGMGVGPSIRWARRDSCFPKCISTVLVGHDKARDEAESLSSLSEVEGARGVVSTMSVWRRPRGIS